jgi:hypothetical protein
MGGEDSKRRAASRNNLAAFAGSMQILSVTMVARKKPDLPAEPMCEGESGCSIPIQTSCLILPQVHDPATGVGEKNL